MSEAAEISERPASPPPRPQPDEVPPPAAAPERRRISGPRLLELLTAAAILVLLVTVALPVGWRWWADDGATQATDDAYVQGDYRILAAKVPGYVVELLVSDFQEVEPNQALLRIEDDDYRAKVDLAEGVVASKQAVLENVAALVKQQQNLIDGASAQVDATSANLEYARVQLRRAQDLLRTPAGQQSTVDQDTASFRALTATLEANRAALAQAKGQLDVLAAQRRGAEADLLQARASLRLARIDLDHTVIRAPVRGRLGRRSVFEGQYLAAGTGVVSLTPLDTVWVVANFREGQLTRMRHGQPVALTVDTYPGVVVRGHTEALSPTTGAVASLLPPDNATGNFTRIVQRIPVKVALEPGHALERRLLPGMSAVVRVAVVDATAPDTASVFTRVLSWLGLGQAP